MSLTFRNPFYKSRAKKSFVNRDLSSSQLSLIGLTSGIVTNHTALKYYRESSAVSIPINMIANQISQILPILRSNDQIVPNSKLINLLLEPGEGWIWEIFIKTIVINFCATGTAYVWASRPDNKLPVAMAALTTTNVNINTKAGGGIQSLQVSMGDYQGIYQAVPQGRKVRYINPVTKAELYQIRDTTTETGDPVEGDSPLESAAIEIQQTIDGNVHNLSLIRNGGVLSLLFSLKGDLGDDQFEAAKEEIIGKYSGASSAGEIGVVDADDIDIKEFGLSPKDMNYDKLGKTAKNAVANVYGVPIVLLDPEKATLNNMTEARLMFFDQAVSPIMSRIFAGLEDLLFHRDGLIRGKDALSYDPLQVPMLKERIIDQLKVRREANTETTNELRDTINREEIEGGDILFMPATQIPIGSDQFTDDNTDVPSKETDL